MCSRQDRQGLHRLHTNTLLFYIRVTFMILIAVESPLTKSTRPLGRAVFILNVSQTIF